MTAIPSIDLVGVNAVLKTALDAVVVMDTSGVVRGWNTVAERHFGISAMEAHGRRMSDLIIPERFRDAHEAGLAHFLATGEGPVLDTMIEIHAVRADGTEIPVELSITYTEHFGEPVFMGFLRDVSARLEAQRTQQLLIDELNHRVKNLLGVVSGIAHLTARNAASPREFAETFTGRLAALGRSHELLTSVRWERAPLSALTAALLEPLADERERVSVTGDQVELTSRELIAVGMILYELLTNAIKYGSLSQEQGSLAISWETAGGELLIKWNEQLAMKPGEPERRGFGTRMIERSAHHDLGGSVEWDWSGQGLNFRLHFKPVY
ncbi:MAG: HWE histidine kinase domain-containing protein [Croceibacterium sp.]